MIPIPIPIPIPAIINFCTVLESIPDTRIDYKIRYSIMDMIPIPIPEKNLYSVLKSASLALTSPVRYPFCTDNNEAEITLEPWLTTCLTFFLLASEGTEVDAKLM